MWPEWVWDENKSQINYYFLVIVDAFSCVFLYRKRVWLRFGAASGCIKCFILAASKRGCHAAIQTRLRRDFNAFHAIKKLHGNKSYDQIRGWGGLNLIMVLIVERKHTLKVHLLLFRCLAYGSQPSASGFYWKRAKITLAVGLQCSSSLPLLTTRDRVLKGEMTLQNSDTPGSIPILRNIEWFVLVHT